MVVKIKDYKILLLQEGRREKFLELIPPLPPACDFVKCGHGIIFLCVCLFYTYFLLLNTRAGGVL